MSATIVCPSGLSLVIRGMRGRELKVLSDRNAFRTGTFFDRILTACTESVIDSGPYVVDDRGGLNWDNVLIGDRIYVMIQIRIETYGKEFSFRSQCGECGQKGEYDADLSSLPVQQLPEEDRESFKAGQALEGSLPDGKTKVRFRLGTGTDEKKVLQLASVGKVNNEDSVLNMLSRRIESIEGVERVKTYLEDAPLGDVTKLLKELNKRDCGVDTTIEMVCPVCNQFTKVIVPVGSAPFWLPVR